MPRLRPSGMHLFQFWTNEMLFSWFRFYPRVLVPARRVQYLMNVCPRRFTPPTRWPPVISVCPSARSEVAQRLLTGRGLRPSPGSPRTTSPCPTRTSPPLLKTKRRPSTQRLCLARTFGLMTWTCDPLVWVQNGPQDRLTVVTPACEIVRLCRGVRRRLCTSTPCSDFCGAAWGVIHTLL
jgi:hypothetical protein